MPKSVRKPELDVDVNRLAHLLPKSTVDPLERSTSAAGAGADAEIQRDIKKETRTSSSSPSPACVEHRPSVKVLVAKIESTLALERTPAAVRTWPVPVEHLLISSPTRSKAAMHPTVASPPPAAVSVDIVIEAGGLGRMYPCTQATRARSPVASWIQFHRNSWTEGLAGR